MFFSRFTVAIATILTVSILSTPKANAQSVIPAGNCAIITGASQDIQQILETLRPYQSFTRPLAIQSNNGFYAASAGIYPDFMAQDVLTNMISSGLIPADSYCDNVDRFINVLLPNPDFTKLEVSLLSQYNYVGEWNTNIKECGSEMMSDNMWITPYSISLPFSHCEVLTQYIPPMGHGSYLGMNMQCSEEGEVIETSMTLMPQGINELSFIEDPDGKIYSRCN